MRCGIYARYSSDLQRESSIEDQIRRNREFTEKQGPAWTVLEDYVRFDQAVSGAAVAGREALQSLIEVAKKKPPAIRLHSGGRYLALGAEPSRCAAID